MSTTATATECNPFSTAFVRPGKLPFLFPDGVTAAGLVDRLAESGWLGQIVGPHGSGKSTLLHTLLPLIRQQRRVEWFTLNSNQRRLPVTRRDRLRWDGSTMVVVDGYQQLSWWQRLRLRVDCRWQSCGLLVTSHADVRLPVVLKTTPSEVTTRVVVQLVQSRAALQFAEDQIDRTFQASGGNVRETLFKLYDLYESQRLIQT